jgi:putative tryptophan/tyrosine transport system substrate-binding protein
MRRREFFGVVSGAATWPVAARAQSAIPVIGFLDSRSPDGLTSRLGAFRQALKEVGFVEGENLKIEYRWADNQIDRLPEMTADLARRQVAVIITIGPSAALAAKAVTTSTPIIFLVGEDPTRLGLVSSLSRPSRNLTGVNLFTAELETKRLQLLHQLLPEATRIAVLVNQSDETNTERTLREVTNTARSMGLELETRKASTPGEVAEVFAALGKKRTDALFLGSCPFFNSRSVQFVQLAAFHRLPAIYVLPEAPEVGGLLSYGPSIIDAYRQCGIYAGHILKGARPLDLPIVQAAKFELVINSTTARLFRVALPSSLVAIADAVIE